MKKIIRNEIMLAKFARCIVTISLVLSILLFTSEVSSANDTAAFSDLTGEWQRETINSAIERGIIKGYDDGTFKPDKSVSEAEFIIMLDRSVKDNELSVEKPLTDDHWAQAAYDDLEKYSLPLLGYKDTAIRDIPIRRGQAAIIIAHIYGFELNVAEAVDFMYENDFSKGNGNKKDFKNFRAFDFLSRAQAAAFLNSMYSQKQISFKGKLSDVSYGRMVTEILYSSGDLPVISDLSANGRYALFQGKIYIGWSEDITLAEQNGRQYANTYLIDQKDKKLVWSNFDRELDFTAGTSQGNQFLVNQKYTITEDYKAKKMLNTAAYTSQYLKAYGSNTYIDEEIFNPLSSMLIDIYNDGAEKLVLISAYRSYQTQSSLFYNRVNGLKASMGLENAKIKAATTTAMPGSSEHQSGMAIDFSTVNTMTLNQPFENTQEGQWLNNNSWKYGFVIRYTADKTHITGIIYEPWHLRFVGIPHAEIMFKSDLCLEEYMDYISNEKVLLFTDYQGYTHHIYYFNSPDSKDLLNFLYLSDRIQSISGDGKGGVIVTTD